MIRALIQMLLGVQLIMAVQQTKDTFFRRLSRQVVTGDPLFLRCPFQVHKDNKSEYPFQRTLAYQIATSAIAVGDA